MHQDLFLLLIDHNTRSLCNLQEFLLRNALYTDGTTLQSTLSKDTYQALKRYTNTRGFSIQMLSVYKPGFVYLTLLGLELQKLGVSQQGVDKTFYYKARQDNKTTSGLESIEEHLNLLLHLGNSDQEKFVTYFLNELHNLPSEIDNLMHHWFEGNADTLAQDMVVPMKQEHPELYQHMIVKRNLAWLPQIIAMAKTPATEMVLVGTAHLAGPDSLLKLLAQKGYKVQRYRPTAGPTAKK